MARKLLEDTKEVRTRKRTQKNSEDDIYKFDFKPIEEQENVVDVYKRQCRYWFRVRKNDYVITR